MARDLIAGATRQIPRGGLHRRWADLRKYQACDPNPIVGAGQKRVETLELRDTSSNRQPTCGMCQNDHER